MYGFYTDKRCRERERAVLVIRNNKINRKY